MNKFLIIGFLNFLSCGSAYADIKEPGYADIKNSCGNGFEEARNIARYDFLKNNNKKLKTLVYGSCSTSGYNWWWSVDKDLEKLHKKAYKNCTNLSNKNGNGECFLYSVNNEVVWKYDQEKVNIKLKVNESEFHLPQVDWSDKTICRLLKSTQRSEYYQVAVQRGLACAGSVKAIISAESSREDYEGHTVLVASDVSKSAADKAKKWLSVAEEAWFSKDDPAWDLYFPIILTIVGTNTNAGEELEQKFCEIVKEEYPDGYYLSMCANPNQPGCTGACSIADYAREGGASITGWRTIEGYHLMILAGNPSPEYKEMIFHEAFHIYQLSHITTKDHREFERKMGKVSDVHNNTVPWWSEGTANYFSASLYSKQPNVKSGYFKEVMGEHLDYYGDGAAPIVGQYLRSKKKLYDIDYSSRSGLGYRVGTWFVAYLVHNEGEQKIFDFYASLDELGFDESFTNHFGKPYRDYVDDFDVFFKQPISKLLRIIP
ncbi:MAG: hypothetical protein ACKVJ9_10365 [Cytophagales bacterium]